jgi:hypothetical protein
MKRTFLAILAGAAIAAGLAGCETATPYQALDPKAQASGGYSDTKLNGDHWRVAFSGNDLTSRETVERYLLFRAAELTVSQGYDWFTTTDKHTDKKSEAFIDPVYGYGWSPNWRFYGRGRWGGYGAWGGGWGGPWGPGWGGPWGSPYGPATIEQFNRYEVSAEILMGHGPRPATGGSLDAHEVMTNLAPKITRPKA